MPDRDEDRLVDDPPEGFARFTIANRGRVPASWATALRRDPQLRSAAVVVDLSMGRGQRRIVLGPKSPTVAAGLDGQTRAVHQSMIDEPELEESLEIGEPGPAGRSVAISVDGRLVGAADLIGTGWPLAGRGEVSLVADDVSWDDRLVWVRGTMASGVSFGRDEEAVDLTVDDPPIGGSEIPPWILDDERWSNIVDQSVGARVPLILGAGVTPCPRVDHSEGIDTDGDGIDDVAAGVHDDFLVCYGHGVTVNRVWVGGTANVEGTGYSVVQTADALELPVTLIRGLRNASAQIDVEVHAKVTQTSTAGLTLATLIRTILHDYGGFGGDRLSDRLFAEFAARAGNYGPDTSTGLSIPRVVVNEPTGALDFVASGLLESYPYVSLVWDGSGIGPVVVDHRSDPVDALARGRGYVLDRPNGTRYKETPISDLRTTFSLQYGYDPVQRTYTGIALRNRRNNALCELAAQVIGGDQVDGQRTSITIQDSASAEASLDWLCEHRCRPSYDVDFECLPIAWFKLRLGDTVLWTDSDVGFNAEKAIVTGRSWSHGMVTITIRVFPRIWKVGGGTTL
jgi:hypothetical protein